MSGHGIGDERGARGGACAKVSLYRCATGRTSEERYGDHGIDGRILETLHNLYDLVSASICVQRLHARDRSTPAEKTKGQQGDGQ